MVRTHTVDEAILEAIGVALELEVCHDRAAALDNILNLKKKELIEMAITGSFNQEDTLNGVAYAS